MLKRIAAVLAGLFVVTVALLGVGGYLIYRAYTANTVDRATYSSAEVGAPRADVEGRLPADARLAPSDVYPSTAAAARSMPAGEDCLHVLARDQTPLGRGVRVYRFCFAAGHLADKAVLLTSAAAAGSS